MLVLSRKIGERIVIGEKIEVVVLETHGDRVRLGFVAPAEVTIHRQEVVRRIEQQKKARRTNQHQSAIWFLRADSPMRVARVLPPGRMTGWHRRSFARHVRAVNFPVCRKSGPMHADLPAVNRASPRRGATAPKRREPNRPSDRMAINSLTRRRISAAKSDSKAVLVS